MSNASNYERIWAKVLHERQVAERSYSNAHRTAYLQSTIIKQLAQEMGCSPQSPIAFANSLQKRSSELGSDISERLRLEAQVKLFRDKYTAMETEQLAILEKGDPFKTAFDQILLAQQHLAVARWYLDSIPESRPQETSVTVVSNEEHRALLIAGLKLWRARLREEHLRIVKDINSLDLGSINLDFGSGSDLVSKVDSITRAIDDAGKNLKIANNGVPVHEYSISD